MWNNSVKRRQFTRHAQSRNMEKLRWYFRIKPANEANFDTNRAKAGRVYGAAKPDESNKSLNSR